MIIRPRFDQRTPSSRPRLLRQLGGWPLLALGLAGCLMTGFVWLAGADTVTGQTWAFTANSLAIHRWQNPGQEFWSPATDLHRIDLLFAIKREILDNSVRLIVLTPRGDQLAQQEVEGTALRHAWYSFFFDPVHATAGQVLRLETRRPTNRSVWLRAGPGASSTDRGVLNGEIDTSFDLAFRAYYAIPPTVPARWSRTVELAQELATGRPGLSGQPVWVLALGGAYAAGLAVLATILLARLRRA